MKFTVKFKNRTYYRPLLIVEPKEIGLNWVDYIREQTGAKLPLDRICGRTKELTIWKAVLSLNEEQARDSGRFRDRNSITVIVYRDLMPYIGHDLDIDRDPETGEISHVQVKPYLDEANLLYDWIQEGYPLEWEPSDDD